MFDACICYSTDDLVTLLDCRRPRARVCHTCCECGETIRPGTKYEVDATVFEGRFTQYTTCIPCANVRAGMLVCQFYYGSLWNDIHDAYCDDEVCICPVNTDATGDDGHPEEPK